MIYIQLFLSFLQVGALSFGGGYAAMPLIQEQVVNLHSWLSMSEFTNLITIAEMTPGPIAVNSATFVGMQIAGILGAVIATLGCILPSCIIVTLLAYVYMKYRNNIEYLSGPSDQFFFFFPVHPYRRGTGSTCYALCERSDHCRNQYTGWCSGRIIHCKDRRAGAVSIWRRYGSGNCDPWYADPVRHQQRPIR